MSLYLLAGSEPAPSAKGSVLDKAIRTEPPSIKDSSTDIPCSGHHVNEQRQQVVHGQFVLPAQHPGHSLLNLFKRPEQSVHFFQRVCCSAIRKKRSTIWFLHKE